VHALVIIDLSETGRRSWSTWACIVPAAVLVLNGFAVSIQFQETKEDPA
jgi:hypothetical protein